MTLVFRNILSKDRISLQLMGVSQVGDPLGIRRRMEGEMTLNPKPPKRMRGEMRGVRRDSGVPFL